MLIKSKRVLILVIITGIFIPCFLSAQFDENRAFNYLQKQVDFGPRVPGSEGHQACLTFLKTELEKFADDVKLQKFEYFDHFHKKQLKLTNIIAKFNSNAKERIFLAAHWDTRPYADYDIKARRNEPIPGANDNASGVAVLLELAHHLKEKKPAVGVDFIFFDGEDYGREGHLDEYFIGSRYFAKNAADYKPKFGILLDMIGDKNLNIPKEANSYQALPYLMDRIWEVAHSMGYYEFEDRIGLHVNDDHMMLLEKGIPCIDIIDFEYPDQRHGFWHTHQDIPENCSPYSLKVVGDVMVQVIYSEKGN